MTQVIVVTEQSQIAEGRRLVTKLARDQGFSEEEAGRCAIVASEMASNLVKFGGGGELLVGSFDDDTGSGVECLALDKGRGMADQDACMRDGYSTAGSAGQGLGAIRRQSHAFDIYSRPGQGTAVLSRLKKGRVPDSPETSAAWSGVSVPKAGEPVCGDGWQVSPSEHGEVVLVVDGLGHGPLAAEASLAAVTVFGKYRDLALAELLSRLHGGLRATRGAALAVARIDRDAGNVEFAGIGNISGTLISSSGVKKMVSHNGTAGHVARKFQSFNYPFQGQAVVVMHSDGIGTSWSIDRYPGLSQRHPG